MTFSCVFKRVVLYARQHRANEDVTETLHRLFDYLSELSVSTYLDVDTVPHFNLNSPPVLCRQDLQSSDLIIVVGGDGSLLSAARMAIHHHVPVIGINRGTLGFLTDISPLQFKEQLTPILMGQYKEENRFLLELQGQAGSLGIALNDIVLDRANMPYLISFDVSINNEFVSHYRADGLILSTPTGSTAYALSAGGPIMHPELNAITLVPMFSHSLSSRPLVLNADHFISIKMSARHEQAIHASCDGQESHLIEPGETLIIKKYPTMLRLLHPMNYHYYDMLRTKLGWGFKP